MKFRYLTVRYRRVTFYTLNIVIVSFIILTGLYKRLILCDFLFNEIVPNQLEQIWIFFSDWKDFFTLRIFIILYVDFTGIHKKIK